MLLRRRGRGLAVTGRRGLQESRRIGHSAIVTVKDGGKEGWLSSTLGKTGMYDNCADAFKNAEVLLHSFSTFSQLASIDGNTLRAPDGEHDDKADALALAVCGRLALLGSGDEECEPILGCAGKADLLWGGYGFDGSWY